MTSWLMRLGPGIALVAVVALGSRLLSAQVSVISALLIAIVVGIAMRNTIGVPRWATPGVAWSNRAWLRTGVVLLGFQLSLPDVARLGWAGAIVIVVTVAVTYGCTLAMGRALRVRPLLTTLVATGFSICGAAAIAASSGILDPRGEHEDDTATAVALVTLYGTALIAALPPLAHALGFTATQSGLWIGASVHEVAQVVAAASLVGSATLAVATVAKLGRVALLAPLAFGQSIVRSRRHTAAASGKRPPLVPLFVVGFLVAMVIRSTGVVPEAVLHAIQVVATFALAGAMFCLGTGVHLRTLARTGARATVLGLTSTLVSLVTAGLLVAALG